MNSDYYSNIISGYKIGIERESLRCDKNGNLCRTPHLSEFGDRMKNRFITTDFGEAQIELRTPPCSTPKECYEKLFNITKTVLLLLEKKGEYLWPYSIPCGIPEESDFVFNDYSGYPDEEKYEKYLSKKYGYRRLCISGIHFNLSVSGELLTKMKKKYPFVPNDPDEAYFRCLHGFFQAEKIFGLFFDVSPTDPDGKIIPDNSFRNSPLGYRNGMEKYIDYSSKSAYIQSIENLLQEKRIMRAGQIYTSIRVKGPANQGALEGLKNQIIDHIEVRACDLNPFDVCGFSEVNIAFATAFLICCMVMGKDVPQDAGSFLSECGKVIDSLNLDELKEGISHAKDILNHNLLPADIIRDKLADEPNLFIKLAMEYGREASEMMYTLPDYPKLEASTMMMISDALMLGIDYRIIDEEKCIVELTGYDKKEVIVQATKTRRDHYIFEYITDDKLYAAEIMEKSGIRTPKTKVITKEEWRNMSFSDMEALSKQPLVIKPKSSNYGNGITVLDSLSEANAVQAAFQYAFSFDNTVLIQEYISGKEYRFFMIGGKCQSVVNRKPAFVIGDGIHSVSELIRIKEATRRYIWGKKKIVINDTSLSLLKRYGLSLDSVLDRGEIIYLQTASNVMLGGETTDVTEDVPVYFKDIASKIATLFGSSGVMVG